MGIVRRVRFENAGVKYQRRCAYCHRPASELYQANFEQGGPAYYLHPGSCFNAAQANYKQNLKDGITPELPKESEDLPDQVAFSNEDNIDKE